jgi:RNA-binding protein YhbY
MDDMAKVRLLYHTALAVHVLEDIEVQENELAMTLATRADCSLVSIIGNSEVWKAYSRYNPLLQALRSYNHAIRLSNDLALPDPAH